MGNSIGLCASLPSVVPAAGDIYKCSDAPSRFISAGGLWLPFVYNLPITVPRDSLFSWVNQGSCTTTQRNDSVLFLNPGTVSNTPPLVSRYQTITNPQFTIVLGFTMAWIYPINANSAPNLEEAQCGLVISDGTKYVTHAYKGEAHRVIGGFNGIDAQGWPWTNDTTQSGSINLTVSQYHATGGPLLWLKLVRDATHLTFYMGPNGQDWTQVNQVANTFLTPTRYGFFTRCGRDTSMAAVIYHFSPGPPTGGCRYYCN